MSDFLKMEKYDDNNNLVERISYYEWTFYTYDDWNEQLVTKVLRTDDRTTDGNYQALQWNVEAAYEYTYLYDNQGRKTERRTFKTTNGKTKIKCVDEYSYTENADNTLTVTNHYSEPSSTEGVFLPISITINKYSRDGLLLHSLRQSWTSGKILMELKYEYDENGNYIARFRKLDDRWILEDSSSWSKYDDNGNLIEVYYPSKYYNYRYDGYVGRRPTKHIFTYDAQNRLISEDILIRYGTYEDEFQWYPIQRNEKSYGDSGNTSSEVTIYWLWDGEKSTDMKERDEIIYDQYGHRSEHNVYSWNSKQGVWTIDPSKYNAFVQTPDGLFEYYRTDHYECTEDGSQISYNGIKIWDDINKRFETSEDHSYSYDVAGNLSFYEYYKFFNPEELHNRKFDFREHITEEYTYTADNEPLKITSSGDYHSENEWYNYSSLYNTIYYYRGLNSGLNDVLIPDTASEPISSSDSVDVFDISGRLVFSGILGDFRPTWQGLFIITSGSRTMKAVVTASGFRAA